VTKDFYAVLGLPRNATSKQIRARFVALARDQHPDRFQGEEKARAEEEFQAITEAFNSLFDAEKRRRHDLDLSRPVHSSQPTQERATKAWLARGVQAYKERRFDEATAAFQRATREEPGNAQAWYYLGLAVSRNELQPERAAGAAARACELDPINPAYLKLAGQLYVRADQPEKAVAFFERALQWGGEDADVAAALSEAQRAAKRRGGRGIFGKMG